VLSKAFQNESPKTTNLNFEFWEAAELGKILLASEQLTDLRYAFYIMANRILRNCFLTDFLQQGICPGHGRNGPTTCPRRNSDGG
jgi:hypothetical protein